MSKNRMNPQTARLSTMLKFPADPKACQCCGATADKVEINLWREHDHEDQPENIYVPLCLKCSKRIIEPHPRLYAQVAKFEPAPGAMSLCLDCVHRIGTTCNSTNSKTAGGLGVLLAYPPPINGFVDGARFRGRMSMFTGPVTACDSKSADVYEGQRIREDILENLVKLHKVYTLPEKHVNRFFQLFEGAERESAILLFGVSRKIRIVRDKYPDGNVTFQSE